MTTTLNGTVPAFATDTVNAEALREAARAAVRDRVDAGLAEPSGKQLGERFGRSERWGRDRIAEVRGVASTRQAAADERQAPASTGAIAATAPVPPVAAEAPPAAVDTGAASDRQAAASTPASPVAAEARGGMPQPRGARAVAWFAFVFGIAVSIAANVAHAYYPGAATLEAWRQQGGTGQWQPEPGAVVGAGFWPLALLLAVEVLSRVQWVPGAWWNLARFGGTGLVATVAAVLSYRHMAGLLLAYGEDPLNAHLGPLAVDGLMVVAGFALLSMGNSGKPRAAAVRTEPAEEVTTGG